jgi:hypothetical protein
MTNIKIGRLLRAGTSGFVVGCRVSQLEVPSFGALVKVPLDNQYQIFGLIHDIHVDDDGLVRQLVVADDVAENIIIDNRLNRIVPLEMDILSIGYSQRGEIYHLLPPRPPLSLDEVYLCDQQELIQFTSIGRFGYFRHILRSNELPVGEILAAHLEQTRSAHNASGDKDWFERAAQELITLLRDDYSTLMNVLGAITDLRH